MAGAIVVIFFVAIALVWALWLIFKEKLLSQGINKLVSYFIGVLLTFVIVLWIASSFLPWWAVKLFERTRSSTDVQTLEQVSQDLWNEAMSSDDSVVISTAVPAPTQAPGGNPQPTPTAQQGNTSSQALGGQTYTVQSGDTLYSLSKKWGVTVDSIKQRNQLSSNQINTGQTLIIP